MEVFVQLAASTTQSVRTK